MFRTRKAVVMEGIQEARGISFELLKKFGTRWAVLAAMRLDMASRGREARDTGRPRRGRGVFNKNHSHKYNHS